MSDFKDNQVEYDTAHYEAGMEAWQMAEEAFEVLSTEEKLEGFLDDHANCLDLVDALLKAAVTKPITGKELALELCEAMENWKDYKSNWCEEWLDR